MKREPALVIVDFKRRRIARYVGRKRERAWEWDGDVPVPRQLIVEIWAGVPQIEAAEADVA